jgi:tetratricopeptide (TPR) repeat protein
MLRFASQMIVLVALAAMLSGCSGFRSRYATMQAWDAFHDEQYSVADEKSERAIVLNPDLARAWFVRGAVALKLKNYSKAIDAFEESLLHDPEKTGAWHNLGVALLAQNKLNAAERAFRRVLTINPNDGAAYYGLGVVYQRTGYKRLALYCYVKALERAPKNQNVVDRITKLMQVG